MKGVKASSHAAKKADIDVTVNVGRSFEWRLLYKLSRDLGYDLPDDLYGAVRNRDQKRLMEIIPTLSPRSILKTWDGDMEKFYAQYQIGALLKKYPASSEAARTKALEKFKVMEKRCQLFNEQNYKSLQKLSDWHEDYLNVIEEIRDDIRRLLGRVPTNGQIFEGAQHGPGSAVGDLYKDGKVTEFFKFSNIPYTVTPQARPYAMELIEGDPRWIGALDDWYRREYNVGIGCPINKDDFWNTILEEVDYNIVTTVPKTADIDRTIAKEPVLNVFLQLGVDRIIRRRLRRRWNYDLNSQELNQALACLGSIYDTFSTIDLEGASETVTLKICELYLPCDWLNLLYDLRCSKGRLPDGEFVEYHKLSSMGNGYTFAVESLIFGAIVRCAVRRSGAECVTAVYGDDLVVPSESTEYLVDLLQLSGFSVNIEKSFTSGPFRESCGEDYLCGQNVRPIFMKNKTEEVQDLFYLYNRFLTQRTKLPWYFECDFSGTLEFIWENIPKEFRVFRGPVTEDLDTHIFCDRKEIQVMHDKYHRRIFLSLERTARRYKKRARDFFFVKLMHPLREQKPQRILDRGAVKSGTRFEITKRDHTLVKRITRVLDYQVRSSNLRYLR